MGLESFKEDDNDSTTDQIVENTKLLNESIDGNIHFPIRKLGASMEHHISKQRIALQLGFMGYEVHTDVSVNDAIYDFYATAEFGDSEVKLAGEIGHCNIEKVYNIKDFVVPFVWVKEGSDLNEPILIGANTLPGDLTTTSIGQLEDYKNDPPDTIKEMGSSVYVDSDGKPFVPRHDLIMTEMLKKVSEVILLTYTDGRQIDPELLASELEGKDVTQEEIETVIDYLGF